MVRSLQRCLILLSVVTGYAGAENLLSIGNGSGDPGANDVGVGLYAKHDQAIYAFSVAVGYEEEALQLTGVDLDAPDIVTGQVGYEYSQVLDDPESGSMILAVLLDLDTPHDFQEIPASPDQEQLLARLVFSVAPDADSGAYPIRLLPNGAGSPAVKNVFTVRPGLSISPQLENGVFAVGNPHTMSIAESLAVPGGNATVRIVAGNKDPLGGYQVVLRYPADLVTLDVDPGEDPADPCTWAATFCGLGLETFLGSPIEFFVISDDPAYEKYDASTPGTGKGRLKVGAAFDYSPPLDGQTLPPGEHQILKVRFRVSSSTVLGQEIPLTLVNGTGIPGDSNDPLVQNSFIVSGPGGTFSVDPILQSGTITLKEGFRRGRINPDEVADIADAVYLLAYLFMDGPVPPCFDAADVNDDGNVDIGDAVRLLGYLFADQVPPPEPFENCGSDPTPDNLDCQTPLGCASL